VAPSLDALIILDQVDLPNTGVVTRRLVETISTLVPRPDGRGLLTIADSRRGLKDYPPVMFKMNAAELAVLTGLNGELSLAQIKKAAADLAAAHGQPVFVSLANRGIVGADAKGAVEHVAALPVRGEIDIVGAGDAVSANLATALAAGANLRETLEIAMAAASVVIHKLGTTGTADPKEIASLL
jgi:bifunctional ADP-heptose synthase (sugar kinase/adenylyltransferase)